MSGTERLSCNSKVTMQHKAYVFAGPSKTKYGDSIGYIDPGDTVCIYWRYGEFYFVEYPVTGGVKTGYTLKTEFNDVPNFNPTDIGLMPQVNPG